MLVFAVVVPFVAMLLPLAMARIELSLEELPLEASHL